MFKVLSPKGHSDYPISMGDYWLRDHADKERGWGRMWTRNESEAILVDDITAMEYALLDYVIIRAPSP